MTSLAATMVRWFEGGVNQGLLPMTSEEESNLFCACHFIELRWMKAKGNDQSQAFGQDTRCSACVHLGNIHNKQYGN
jgi:hypothetical protein